ncbi:MAG TPA: ThiF family adenylyltransferase [Verrucomicrobiae bacterium]|nr:ThiF family adenylyltransferase [Verrucomicrobiae bacterium]
MAIGHHVEGMISADASGWTARINGVFSEKSPAAPPAITFAIACAVAKLFNQAIFDAHQNAHESWDFCLLRFLSGVHSPIQMDQKISLGRIGVLGAGAIGSALGCVLSISDWSGAIEVIDYDAYQDPNLETCVFADIQDVNRPLRKALALAEALKGKNLDVHERRCKVEAGAGLLAEPWDAFVCAVDNPETRRILDDANARVLLNAGVGASKHDMGWVLWTQHGQPGQTKLSSLYQADSGMETADAEDVPEEFREECSRMGYQGVSLALPFAGLAAGSLLAASLVQQANGKQTPLSFIQLDLLGKQQRMTVR